MKSLYCISIAFLFIFFQKEPVTAAHIIGGYMSYECLVGDPPYSVSSNTGEITGLPNVFGSFVYGLCVDEYRNGVLLSSIRLESIHFALSELSHEENVPSPEETFRVVPNPALGFARLEMPVADAIFTIVLFDLNGTKCKTYQYVRGDNFLLDIAGLEAGVYCLRAETDGIIYTSRFVIL